MVCCRLAEDSLCCPEEGRRAAAERGDGQNHAVLRHEPCCCCRCAGARHGCRGGATPASRRRRALRAASPCLGVEISGECGWQGSVCTPATVRCSLAKTQHTHARIAYVHVRLFVRDISSARADLSCVKSSQPATDSTAQQQQQAQAYRHAGASNHQTAGGGAGIADTRGLGAVASAGEDATW